MGGGTATTRAEAAEQYDSLYRPPMPVRASYFDRRTTNPSITALTSGMAHLGPEVEMGFGVGAIDDDAAKHATLVAPGSGQGSQSVTNFSGKRNAGKYDLNSEIDTPLPGSGGRRRKGKQWLSLYGMDDRAGVRLFAQPFHQYPRLSD